MLRAILHGKAGRVVIGGVDHSWRELFRQREDLLSSVFFSRIPYLSPEAIGRVLALLVSSGESEASGPFRDIAFWPRLPGDGGRRFVEPDILIEFENSTVLVEVKPPAGGAQHYAQWQAEIAALVRHNEHMGRPAGAHVLHFVALGRNPPNWKAWKEQLELDMASVGLKIHVIEWMDVCAGVMDLLGADYSSRDKAVFSDWIEAFSLYGIRIRTRPFEELLDIEPGIEMDWETLFDTYPIPKKSAHWKPLSDLVDTLELRISTW